MFSHGPQLCIQSQYRQPARLGQALVAAVLRSTDGVPCFF
jgi:hypothetical protein